MQLTRAWDVFADELQDIVMLWIVMVSLMDWP